MSAADSITKSVLVSRFLIDYENVARDALQNAHGASPNFHEDAMSAIQEIAASVLARRNSSPKTAELRLYHGWHDAALQPTQDYLTISALRERSLSQLTPSGVGLRITVVDRPISAAPGQGPIPTYQLVEHLDNFKPRRPAACTTGALCAYRQVISFLTEQCREPTCGASLRTGKEKFQQKMVDAMIVADTIALASEDDGPLFVVSNDQDIIPGLLAAAAATWAPVLVRVNPRKSPPGIEVARRAGISIEEIRL